MELASKYDPQAVESKWYQYWLDNNATQKSSPFGGSWHAVRRD